MTGSVQTPKSVRAYAPCAKVERKEPRWTCRRGAPEARIRRQENRRVRRVPAEVVE